MAFNFSSIGKLIASFFESPTAGATSQQSSFTHTIVGAATANATNGSLSQSENITTNANRRGIKQTRTSALLSHAVGDSAALYVYNRQTWGVAYPADEGATGITAEVLEDPVWFHGIVSSTTGTGDTAPVLANTGGANYTIDGGYLLNISKGTLHGTLTGSSANLSLTINSGSVATFLNFLTVSGASLPVSTAIGIATAAISPATTTRDVPVAVTITVNLAQIGGIFPPFVNGQVVTVAGPMPEQSIVSAAGAVSGSNQQIFTLHVCNFNAQAVIFQGGIQGQYISADANDVRSAYFAFGSLTGTDLIYGNQVTGSLTNHFLPNLGCEKWTATGGNSAWHLYPGAEVVKNTDNGSACQLEQNGVAWAATDVVECAKFPTGGGATAFFVREQYTPSSAAFGMSGLQVVMIGPGTSGANTVGIRLTNGYTPANYFGSGGPLQAPNGLAINGQFATPIFIQTAPDGSMDAILKVQNNNTANADVCNVIQLLWDSGGNVTFTKSTHRWAFSGAVDAQNGFLANHIPGISVTRPVAPISPQTIPGSETFTFGILTAYTPPS